ncbi:MAG: hypothetical protein HN350_21935 [Phycisphaerales bacterium]|nr:hypothetical protein [Phycisphaerales bacterium]
MSAEERQAMMESCLMALLTEFSLHQEGTMALVDMLHDADSESYVKTVKPWVKRGLFVGTGGLDSTVRYAWNKVAIVRPCLIDDLGLQDTDDLVMLDSALAAYLQYLQLTAEVKRSNWGEYNRDLKRVAQLAQINSAAQSSLKIYLGIMKDLRFNKARKEAEQAERQRQRSDRPCRPARTVEKSVAGGKILSEFEDANSTGRSPVSSEGETEVQS